MRFPVKPIASSRERRAAVIALLVSTVCWGGGFTWAKVGGETINRVNHIGHGGALGPILLLGARFVGAGILWLLIFPRARRGWSPISVRRSVMLGTLLAAGLIPQHLGLELTSEAVSAFLTSLSIVFVPILSTLLLRRPPALRVWIGVAIATAGVWLMTGGASGATFGKGEALGVACAILFSMHVLAVNAIVPRDDPFRMTGGQLVVIGVVSLAVVPFLDGGVELLDASAIARTFSPMDVWLNCALLAVFATIVAFGLLTHFQPRLDATHAALIYLMEPIFASIYAFVFIGRGLTGVQLLGAGAILVANVIVELLGARKKRVEHAPREMV